MQACTCQNNESQDGLAVNRDALFIFPSFSSFLSKQQNELPKSVQNKSRKQKLQTPGIEASEQQVAEI